MTRDGIAAEGGRGVPASATAFLFRARFGLLNPLFDDVAALVLAIVGGLFVFEALSVIIQVFWFKRTGKRVFRMAPIHHHFEQLGWSESKVVIRFWIVSIVLALMGLATLKLR